MKKIVFGFIFIIFLDNVAYAGRYTIGTSSFKNENTLNFETRIEKKSFEIELSVEGEEVKLTTRKFNLNELLKFDFPQTLTLPKKQPDIFNDVDELFFEAKKTTVSGREIKEFQSLNQYTLSEMYGLMFHNQVADYGPFLVTSSKEGYLCEIVKEAETGYSIFSGETRLSTLLLKVEKSYDNSTQKTVTNEQKLLKVYFDGQNLVGFDIFIEKSPMLSARLKLVRNEHLSNFLKEEKDAKITISKLDFNREPLTLVYLQETQKEVNRLFVTLSKVGEKKNIVKLHMKGPSSLFRPELSLNTEHDEISFIGEVKKEKRLFQIRGEMISDEVKDFTMHQDPKSPFLYIDYLDVNAKQESKEFLKSNRDYYTRPGLWYLLSWLYFSDIEKLSIMLFLDSTTPLDYEINKSEEFYELTRAGKVIYRFLLSKNGVITKFEFPYAGQTLQLEDIFNQSILKNREYLDELRKKFNIIEVKSLAL